MKFLQVALTFVLFVLVANAKPLQCKQYLENPLNGFVECTGSSIGSVCYFECDIGYELKGCKSSKCIVTSTGTKWNANSPKCIRKLSPACNSLPRKPENGFIDCFDGKSIGSFCFFGCNEGYSLVGNEDTLCFQTGENSAEWDLGTPICSKNCPKPGKVLNGNVKCSTAEYERLNKCSYQCEEGYQLRPSYNKDLHCLHDGQWNASKPCCAATTKCDDSTAADIVIAIDNSFAFGANSFKTAKDYIRDFIDSFSLYGDNTRFSVFQFNREIDSKSQILFSHSPKNRQGLLEDFQNMPNELGEGLFTGKALHYINDEILKEENGDRPDVRNIVILFTGTKSQDNVEEAAVKLIQNGRTSIYLVGLEPYSGSFGLEYLESLINGSVKNVLPVEAGTDMKLIDDALTNLIGGHSLCRVQC